MPHLYTTAPTPPFPDHWTHDRDKIFLIRVTSHERPYFVKIHFLKDTLCRISLLTTSIDLILNYHKELLLDAVRQLGVRILKGNLGNKPRNDVGIKYLLSEETLSALNWKTPKPKVFEIGSGNGAFLCEHARRNPEKYHLGVEINSFTLKKALRKAAKAGLSNIHFIRNDAEYILNYHVPDAALETIYIHFPDPWEKKRHTRRRIINPETLQNFARVLKHHGKVHFTTDHQDYAFFTKQAFHPSHYFALLEENNDVSLPFPTKYERKWRSEGRRIIQLIFQRTETPFPPSTERDTLFREPLQIETSHIFTSGEIYKAKDFVIVFRDVYKGTSFDVLDTVIAHGRYRWNTIFLKWPRTLAYDPHLNKRFLTFKIKDHLESLSFGAFSGSLDP